MSRRVATTCARVILLCAGGCSLGQKTPKRNVYALHLTPPQALDPGTAGVVQIDRIRVARLFERKALVYRTSDDHYESDFYHAFYAPPGEWIRQSLGAWFDRSGFFTRVVGPTDNVTPDWWIEGRVEGLHADVRDPSRPYVEVEIEFSVIDPKTVDLDSVFVKRYGSVVALPDARPDSVVNGMRQAWLQIFESFDRDLREALPESESARAR